MVIYASYAMPVRKVFEIHIYYLIMERICVVIKTGQHGISNSACGTSLISTARGSACKRYSPFGIHIPTLARHVFGSGM